MATFREMTPDDERIIGIQHFNDRIIVATARQLYEVVNGELRPIVFEEPIHDK